MFKNLQLFRIPAGVALDPATLEAQLATGLFMPCQSLDVTRTGWVPPREHGALVHTVNKQMLLALRTDTKLLPASVINEATKVRAAEICEQQGFMPGRRQMKEIKEQVTDDLLPKAFTTSRRTLVWIDVVNGWVAIDAATANQADGVIKMLFKMAKPLPLQSLRPFQTPGSAMTQWLQQDEAPAGFTVDKDADLHSTVGGGAGSVRYVCESLGTLDVQRHILSGKRCTRLAMTWQDKISFTLNDKLEIKRIVPLQLIKESANSGTDDADEHFDSDMVLMTGELAGLFTDLVAALGGEVTA